LDLIVEGVLGRLHAGRGFEVVERKGIGHPDTVCDAVAEAFGVALARHYLDRFGSLAHFNVDKALLWGGSARPAFGGGEVTAPIEIFLAGRAALQVRGERVPVEDLAVETTRRWLRENLPEIDPERHVKVHCLVRPGSAELVDLFGRGAARQLANDTSCGVGFAPLSCLEGAVLAVARELNARATKAAHPEVGDDVKVMATRHGARVSLTVACAMIDRRIRDAADYAAKVREVGGRVSRVAAACGLPGAEIAVNAADDVERGDVYLTVTGTSAEAGDDGQVGRGNRANGLITPCRPMSLEAVAGKNPWTHVGKLYNIAASRIAAEVHAEIADAEAYCWLVSRIGQPVDDPALAGVRVVRDGRPPDARERARIADIVRSELAAVPRLYERVIRGEIGLF
jgi:S-adenosylmethionine synthetase